MKLSKLIKVAIVVFTAAFIFGSAIGWPIAYTCQDVP